MAKKRNKVRKIIHHNNKINQTKRLERVVGGISALICVPAGLFLLSPQISGNVIGDAVTSAPGIAGALLLIAGLIGTYVWEKAK